MKLCMEMVLSEDKKKTFSYVRRELHCTGLNDMICITVRLRCCTNMYLKFTEAIFTEVWL